MNNRKDVITTRFIYVDFAWLCNASLRIPQDSSRAPVDVWALNWWLVVKKARGLWTESKWRCYNRRGQSGSLSVYREVDPSYASLHRQPKFINHSSGQLKVNPRTSDLNGSGAPP
jgi:hypothetical protein